VVPNSIHEFFAASGGAAAALIGLLFVALSVASERVAQATSEVRQLHRIRASAALTAFTNALTVSLFALIPGHKIGPTAVAVAAFGLAFVAASLISLISLIRLRQVHLRMVRDLVFLLGLTVVFVIQLIQGADVSADPGDFGAVQTIAVLVVLCFLVGIARGWELIGGPSIEITKEVTALIRGRNHAPDAPGPDAPGPGTTGPGTTGPGTTGPGTTGPGTTGTPSATRDAADGE
jgi:hypothetical protein